MSSCPYCTPKSLSVLNNPFCTQQPFTYLVVPSVPTTPTVPQTPTVHYKLYCTQQFLVYPQPPTVPTAPTVHSCRYRTHQPTIPVLLHGTPLPQTWWQSVWIVYTPARQGL
ncbi:hypothetical protein BsWGS_13601 [Bradybaena similaris]